MKIWFNFFILITFFPQITTAVECSWWQTKVKTATISQHQRKDHTVSKHIRQEHCREKWKGADTHINQFKNDPISGWDNKGETFKRWNQAEIRVILETLSKLPAWCKIENYTFRRADKSIHKENPATSELTTKTIILYDNFFTYKDQLGAIGHEASHFIFQKLTDLDITEFEQLSGWNIETKDRKVYVIPPKNPLMPDSFLNNEEDFTNHAEMYISNPVKLKKINPKMYDFFLKRFPE